MGYDIAIGRCLEIENETAIAKVELATLRKLRPQEDFPVNSKARLRIELSICSRQRPPRQGEELFLDIDKVKAGGASQLDADGDGSFVNVDIRLLAADMDPLPRPTPADKSRGATWPPKKGR